MSLALPRSRGLICVLTLVAYGCVAEAKDRAKTIGKTGADQPVAGSTAGGTAAPAKQQRSRPDALAKGEAAKAETAKILKVDTKEGPPVLPPPGKARSSYRDLIEKEALGTGLSPDIAESVMEVESGFNPGAIGSSGEIGLMQVMPSTARMMGFSDAMSALATPETNIHYGVTYLAQAYRKAGGDLCTAVMKYRAGHGETRFSSLSVDYCLAVRAKLRARGVPVFGTVPVADFMSGSGGGPPRLRLAGSGPCRRGCIGGGDARVDFAGINAQLTSIVVQVRPPSP